MVVEPVEVSGGHVEPQEIVAESCRARSPSGRQRPARARRRENRLRPQPSQEKFSWLPLGFLAATWKTQPSNGDRSNWSRCLRRKPVSGSSQPNSMSFFVVRAGVAACGSSLMAGKVSAIARLQFREIGRHQVDLAADRLGLAGLQAADSKVGMEADDDALKQLLIRLPGGRHQLLAVSRDAADQTI